MKGDVAFAQEKCLDSFKGLWTVFEQLGVKLGNTLGDGIDALFDAIDNHQKDNE